MGVDIHMYIVRGNAAVKKNIFEGRNSEWFRDLQGDGWKDEYDNLPRHWGIPDEAPEYIQEGYDKSREIGYYGFNYVNVADYVEWFEKYRPDKDAGWVSTYDAWRIKNKGYVPEDPIHYLDEDMNKEDYTFMEFEDPYDCGKWLYDYITSHDEIQGSDTIVYYFDC
jgi:hypothetical protein